MLNTKSDKCKNSSERIFLFKQKKYIFIVLLLTFGALFFYNKKLNVNLSKTIKVKKTNTTRLPASASVITKNELPQENHAHQKKAPEPLAEEKLSLDKPTYVDKPIIVETAIIEASDNYLEQTKEVIINDVQREKSDFSEVINYDQKIALMIGPKSNTKEVFEFNHYTPKHPVKLKWSEVNESMYYEIEVNNLSRSHKRYFKRTKDQFNVMLFPNENYEWRVLAYNQDGKPITHYSDKFPLKIIAPAENYRSLASNKPTEDAIEYNEPNTKDSRQLSSVDDSYIELEDISETITSEYDEVEEDISEFEVQTPPLKAKAVKESEKPLWSKLSIWGGVGASVSTYSQESTNIAELSHTSLRQPHLGGEASFMITDYVGVSLSASYSPGRLVEESNLFDAPYTWETYNLEVLYLLGNSWKASMQKSWYLKAGLSYQSIPLMAIFQTTNSVELIANEQITAGVGIGRKSKITNKLSTNIHMSAQMPISSEVSKYIYELDTGFTMQAFAGLKYRFKRSFHLGAYWQGKLLNNNYYLSDGFEDTSGHQFLLNNNLGLFMGYDF